VAPGSAGLSSRAVQPWFDVDGGASDDDDDGGALDRHRRRCPRRRRRAFWIDVRPGPTAAATP
jgi:hypothetical protein